ncbi:MAG: molybdenum cofactor biosynthesis protein [Acidobacteria bacterium]|nr:MAG: molybdenum cofactor biosynthesis protein [Acidobacteriota bacterium]
MRPFGDTISLDEARGLIGRALKPIERIEPVALEAAHGRVLAQDVVATADVPPFSRAAMDGYAVRAADTAGATPASPVVLAWIEKVFTGQMPSRTVGGGECIEIATGAPMPDGADSVVMVEETAADGPRIQIFNAANSGQNIGRQGADIKTGQTVMRRGDLLNASRVGAIAALGLAHVDVYAQPRVAILSTGNEIVEPGRPLQPGQIYDINRFTVAAVVAEHGGVPIPHRTDVLVFSGGTSVGERDLILDALGSRGEVLFHGISVKPGKPTAFGLVNGRPFFGMPGYPSSCLLNTHILLVPALRLIARLPPAARRTVTLPLARRVLSAKDRHQFYTVRVADGVAIPAYKASGDITSMSQADGYFEIDAATDAVAEGTLVEVTLF